MFLSYCMYETNIFYRRQLSLKISLCDGQLFKFFHVDEVDVFYSLFLHVINFKGHVGPMHKFVCN